MRTERLQGCILVRQQPTLLIKIIKEISISLAEVMSPKLEMLGPLRNQKVHLRTDSKTLYYSILKLKYSSSILKHNKG